MKDNETRPVVEYVLNTGESKDLTIVSREFYSAEKIVVRLNQKYQITVAKGQTWTDWFIDADPLFGFFNLLALVKGMRVRGAKCFTLCATFNDSDAGSFRVLFDQPLVVIRDDAKTLSFFANDSKGFYSNNRGSIILKIERLL